MEKKYTDDPYDESKLLGQLKYKIYFDKLLLLKEKLAEIKNQKTNPAKMKELETDFIEGLNEIVLDVNKFCTDTVTEITESFNFINRKFVGEKMAPTFQTLLSDEVAATALEIVRLDQFVQTMKNIMLELVRRNDSSLGVSSSSWFSARLSAEYFTNINFSGLILGLSEVYQNIREGLKKPSLPLQGAAKYKTKNTAKFWVRRADLVKVKAMIVKHIPAIKWEDDTEIPIAERADTRKYTSVYLDNDKFTFYKQILNEENGATQFRVEWYDDNLDESFFEEKVFRDWDTNSTTDMRFPIKHKFIGSFLKGDWNYETYGQKQVQKNEITQEKYEETNTIASGMQKILVENEMKAVLKSEYQRSVYHDPGLGLRIVLDDDLVLTRERSEKGRWTKGSATAPTQSKDQTQFPFAILQIKYVDKCPEWIEDFQRSAVLLGIEGHFSKFLYGIAKFYSEQLLGQGLRIPPWFNSFEKSHQQLERRRGMWFFSHKEKAPRDPGEIVKKKKKSSDSSSSEEITGSGYLDLEVEDEDLGTGRFSQMDDEMKGSSVKLISKPSSASSSLLNLPKPKTEIKPVRVPVKVEPKTFFANERTLLQWLNSVVVLSTVALALIGLGDDSARLSGLILLPISLFFALYSLVVYHIRRISIRDHKPTPAYDDKVGPYVLVLVFIIATIISVVIPIIQSGNSETKIPGSYPFFPADLPFQPEEVRFFAPLPSSEFINRTDAMANFITYLKSLPHSFKFSFDEYSITEQFQRFSTLTTQDDKLASNFRLTRLDGAGESITTFSLLPTMENFKTIQFPQVRPGYYGKSNFVLDINCNRTSFYYSSAVENIPPPRIFGDLENFITDVTVDLQVNGSVPIFVDPKNSYPSFYTWKVNSLINSYIASLIINIPYKTPAPYPHAMAKAGQSLPQYVSLSLVLNENKGGSGFPITQATDLMRRIITDYWAEWPVECERG